MDRRITPTRFGTGGRAQVKAFLLALVFPLALGAQMPADSARPIGLNEAVQAAQKVQPLTVQARGQIRSNAAGVKGAYAAFIPSASVSVGAAYNPDAGARVVGDRIVSGSKWSGSDGINFNVNLFDGGRKFLDIRTAKANVNAAEANEVAQRFNVSLNVKQAYYNALAARESEGAARTQLEQAQAQLAVASAKVAAGAATKSDSLRQVIQVQNGQLALLTAQNNLRIANASLTRLVASPYTVTASTTDTLDVQQPALPDSAQLLALASRGPTVMQAEAALTAAQTGARAARTPYLPSIDASFGRSANGTDLRYGYGDQFSYASTLRFSLSYPLFNQLTRETARVRADVAAVNADAQLRDARFAAEQNLTQYLGTIQTAQQRESIQAATVAAAEEDLRVQQQRYAAGASTLLDVLTSQTTLNQARVALIQARYDSRIARAQIAALIGKEY